MTIVPSDQNKIVEQQRLPDFPLWHKESQRRRLFSFELELTARCNLNCRHCYINLPVNDRSVQTKELSFEEIERVAEEAVAFGALWCLITGGEPLVREDFEDVYIMLKRKGVLVSIFTNATLLDDHHIRLFEDYPPRGIEVTMYGASEATYERICRRRGAFNAFQKGIGRLVDADIPVTLKTVALRSNVHEFSEITRFCHDNGRVGFRYDPFLHLRLDRDKKRNREIMAERLSAGDIMALEAADNDRLCALVNTCQLFESDAISKDSRLLRCRAGLDGCTIGWDGKLRLCSSLTHPDCVFDLREMSFSDAWRDGIPKIRELRSQSTAYQASCGSCGIINACLWCPAHAYLETGSLETCVPYFCEIANGRVRQAEEARLNKIGQLP